MSDAAESSIWWELGEEEEGDDGVEEEVEEADGVEEEVVDCPAQLICTWIFICCVPRQS